jgi:transcriptional pleiotropic regulator of transition state genes
MTGITRKVDELGRIVLPIEHRRVLDIAERDSLEILVEGDHIILRKFHPACVFCGEGEEVADYMGKNVCRACVEKLKAL